MCGFRRLIGVQLASVAEQTSPTDGAINYCTQNAISHPRHSCVSSRLLHSLLPANAPIWLDRSGRSVTDECIWPGRDSSLLKADPSNRRVFKDTVPVFSRPAPSPRTRENNQRSPMINPAPTLLFAVTSLRLTNHPGTIWRVAKKTETSVVQNFRAARLRKATIYATGDEKNLSRTSHTKTVGSIGRK